MVELYTYNLQLTNSVQANLFEFLLSSRPSDRLERFQFYVAVGRPRCELFMVPFLPIALQKKQCGHLEAGYFLVK